MKKLLAAAALIGAFSAWPAGAADRAMLPPIGDPGYYGQLDVRNMRPRLTSSQPTLVQHRYPNLAPIYLRVPPGHARNWAKHCDEYNACTRPVYFVQDDWYRNEYAPRYLETQGHPTPDGSHRDNGNQGKHDDKHDEKHDDKNGDRH